MTVTVASPGGKDDPLSYEHLDGEWRDWYQVAHRFERKVPQQDRGDIRHTIILELAKARARDGEPIPTPRACRIASIMVALYWRKAMRKPTILSLDRRLEDAGGNGAELIETVADDKAIDLDAWLDARTWLLGCPIRLVQVASKRLAGTTLEPKDKMYLQRFRQREKRSLLSVTF